MKKFFKKFLFQSLIASMVLFAGSLSANAKEISVSTYKELDNALKEAKTEATAENPYIITVTKSIDATYTLRIYSNTTLICKSGVTIKQRAEDKNILRLGDPDDAEAVGYYYENVTIDGGVWDAVNGTATGMKFAHGKNITLKNLTLKNVKNAHLMEVAGVDGLTMENVTMANMILEDPSKKRYEAIQLDVLAVSHFSGYMNSEDLPIKNVKVDNCKFTNVPRGIGGHTGVLNNPITNVSITNCTFEKVKSCAIQIFNVENLTISKNTIDGSPRGIAVLSAAFDNQDTYLPSTLAKESGIPTTTSDKYIEPKEDQGIVITENTITTKGSDPFANYESGAIWLNGKDLGSSGIVGTGNGDKLPRGDYFISGVTITNNTVTSSGYGVKICDVRNANIYNNTFTCTSTKPTDGVYTFSVRDASKTTDIYDNTSTGFYIGTYVADSNITRLYNNTFSDPKKYGVELINGTIDEISTNTITNPDINGIYLINGSGATTITGNTILNPQKYGIGLESNSNTSKVSENTISKPGMTGIYVARNCNAGEVNKNNISSPVKYGIGLETESSATSISKNTISSPGMTGVYLARNCTATAIDGNKITSAVKYGIGLETESSATSITKNTISSPGQNGIYLARNCTATTIDGNKITSAGKYGIGLAYDSNVSSISTNTVSKAKVNAIYLLSSCSAKNINSNKITSSGKYGISIEDKSTVTNLDKNTVTTTGTKDANGSGIFVCKKSEVNSITSNKVSKAKKHGIGIDDGSTAGSISKNTVADSGQNGISVRNSKATSIVSNTISNSGKDGIFSEKSTIKNLKSNSITNSAASGINIYLKSKITTFSSNTVNKAKRFGITVGKDCSVKKKSGNKIKSCKTKTFNF